MTQQQDAQPEQAADGEAEPPSEIGRDDVRIEK
jgi:hypothetical protein